MWKKKKNGKYEFKKNYSIEYFDYLIKTKYVPKLKTTLKGKQMNFLEDNNNE